MNVARRLTRTDIWALCVFCATKRCSTDAFDRTGMVITAGWQSTGVRRWRRGAKSEAEALDSFVHFQAAFASVYLAFTSARSNAT